jgi:predicted nucleic-acid-binding protein
MIGIDTNVLLRAVLNDDARQSPVAREILSQLTAEKQGVVNSVTLAEFVWTLRRGYGYTQEQLLSAVKSMLRSNGYVFVDRRCVSAAISRCESESLGFADALIGEINRAAGCATTLTFDGKAGKTDLFRFADAKEP